MDDLLIAPKESIIWENEDLYICLASFPITKGHTIVVWKKRVDDIHLLERKDFLHLMDLVEKTRNLLLDNYLVEKVYLLYLDEIKHVHWHLVPRYEEGGFNILKHSPKKITNFDDVINLKLKAIRF